MTAQVDQTRREIGYPSPDRGRHGSNRELSVCPWLTQLPTGLPKQENQTPRAASEDDAINVNGSVNERTVASATSGGQT